MNYIIAKTINFLGLSAFFAASRQQRRQHALDNLDRFEANRAAFQRKALRCYGESPGWRATVQSANLILRTTA
jgi:hypothetical protein